MFIHSDRAKFHCPLKSVKQHLHKLSLQNKILAPRPQSHSFSRGYGTILPTSLNHLTLFTRGCRPRRPDAVMGTDECVNDCLPRLFMGQQKQTGCLVIRNTIPIIKSYLQASCFQDLKLLNKNENTPRRFRKRCRVRLCYHKLSTSPWRNVSRLTFHNSLK